MRCQAEASEDPTICPRVEDSSLPGARVLGQLMQPQVGTFNSGGELVLKMMPVTVLKEKIRAPHLKSDCIERLSGFATKILGLLKAGGGNVMG